jgi:hypothetical protein
MKSLEQIYLKPITRLINPAVVVDERNPETIQQETEEYVFTKGIFKGIHTFLNAVTTPSKGKTGIWVNGYYGSGKSHFIKYLSYCLDAEYGKKALDRYVDKTRTQTEQLPEITPNVAQEDIRNVAKFAFEKIIFNIDNVSGAKNKDNVLVKVFFNQFNKFRGFNDSNIPLALYLEKQLANVGKLEAFHAEIKSQFKGNWLENYIDYVNTYLNKVLDIAVALEPSLDTKSLSNAIFNQQQDFRIEDLINEFVAFLKDKPEDYRLIFLIDEVSQYIGSNTSLLLNLQTIIEGIGTSCQSKIWVVCTAQQDLSNVIDRTDNKQEDFGKILGRFDTRISLESQDAAQITKMRLLDKNDDAKADLKDYFKQHKAAIENQFSGFHDLYKNYTSELDFVETYPFVPYQFRLISDVFSAFSQAQYVGEGVKDNERSIIGITHYTAKEAKAQSIGYFVPFDQFFNDNFKKDLIHYASNLVNRAYGIKFDKESPEFSKRVVNVLFLISNISEVLQIQFPANTQNMAVLMIENLNQSKKDLEAQIRNVLTELVDKKIVQELEGVYRFFKEDEIEVAGLIDNTQVSMPERLEFLNAEIISKTFKKTDYKFNFGNNTFRAGVAVDGSNIGSGKGDFDILFSIYNSTPLENFAHQTERKKLVVCIYDWFNNDESFKKDFTRYVRTAKYIANNRSSSGSRKDTIDRFGRDNDTLIQKLRKHFEANLTNTPYIIAQRVVLPSELSGQNTTSRFDEAVDRLLSELYSKNSLAGKNALTNADLLKNAQEQQKIVTEPNAAEIELDAKINLLGSGCSLEDVIKKMEEAPFGWRDLNTINTLLGLAQKGKRRFEHKNNRIESYKDFMDKAFNARERSLISILSEQTISVQEVKAFIETVNNDIFSENILPPQVVDAKTVMADFKAKLTEKINLLTQNAEQFEGFPFNSYFKNFKKSLDTLASEREALLLFKKTQDLKIDLGKQRDIIKQLDEFLENRAPQYFSFRTLVQTHKDNFAALDEAARLEADKLSDYVQSDDKPYEHYHAMLKIYRSLEAALKELIVSLKEQAKNAYQAAFTELTAEQQKLNITEGNVLPDIDYTLRSIDRSNNITDLKLKLRQVSDFKTDGLKSLYDFKTNQNNTVQDDGGNPKYTSKKTDIFSLKNDPDLISTIENEDDLNLYLDTLRRKLLERLKNNKIIILK